MREIRPSGSEGGVALTTPSLPLSNVPRKAKQISIKYEWDPAQIKQWKALGPDSLHGILAPALDLAHLLRRGRALALSLRRQRPNRAMQLVRIRRIFGNR